jgi:glutaredoxin-like protein
MEKLLNDEIVGQIRGLFQKMEHPVELILFVSQDNCDYCTEVRQLLEEVAPLSDLLGLRVYDLAADADVAARFGVSEAPAILITAREADQVTDLGVRYLGIPSGHEFGTLIQDILLVSGRDSGLSAETRAYLKGLTSPLLLQVFVTPTCPYCPRAVLLAHQFAMENPAMIRAEGVEAMEFAELSEQFQVSGVPDTIINSGAGRVVGAVPEGHLLDEIRRAVQGGR